MRHQKTASPTQLPKHDGLTSERQKGEAQLTHPEMQTHVLQAMREEHAKQRYVWASTKKTLQAQQSSLQDECNDLACQLAERDEQLRCRDERILQLKKQLQEADLTVSSRRGSEV